MIQAFWDSSSLVPLCVNQPSSLAVQALRQQYSMTVWWATGVEIMGAFERLLRVGLLDRQEYFAGRYRLEQLEESWREVQPSDSLREHAKELLARYPLKAADSLQLAAAWTWSSDEGFGTRFIYGDVQLLSAASQLGLQTIQA